MIGPMIGSTLAELQAAALRTVLFETTIVFSFLGLELRLLTSLCFMFRSRHAG